ncbi:MAG: hypothetical protein ABIF82_09005 [Planctomycetota bacterium]
MKTSLFALLLFVACAHALADTVFLNGGGKIEGTVDTILFLEQGEKSTFARADVTLVFLSAENGQDKLVLKKGLARKGDLASITIRSVGGILSFDRGRLKSVNIAEDSQVKLIEEYLRRKAKIRPDNAADLCELAAWCNENRLIAEAHSLATQCLKLKPDADTSALAHSILGHVLRDGKWEKPTLDKLPAEQPPPTDAEAKNVDPAAVALLEKIIAEYVDRAAEAQKKDQETWKTTYQPLWQEYEKRVTALEKQINDLEARKQKLRDDIQLEKRRRRDTAEGDRAERLRIAEEIRRLENELRDVTRELSTGERSYTSAKNARTKLRTKMIYDKARIGSRDVTRRQNIALAQSKIVRLLQLGRKLDEADMRKVCEELCGK